MNKNQEIKENKDKKLSILIFSTLLIGVVILIIIIRTIVNNFALKYIFVVPLLSLLCALIFYNLPSILKREDLWGLFLISILCWLIFPYLFSWIHEFFHVIVALFNGFNITGIEVYFPYGGVVHLPPESGFILVEKAIKYCWISLSGSLGSGTSVFIINRISYKKITDFSIFFSIYMITWFWLIYECLYWLNGTSSFLKGVHSPSDAYSFLYLYVQINPQFNPAILWLILSLILFFILIYFTVSLIKRIKYNRNLNLKPFIEK